MASAALAPVLNLGAQVSWNVFQAGRRTHELYKEHHEKRDTSPTQTSLSINFQLSQLYISVVVAVLGVFARYAAFGNSADGPAPLMELYVSKSDVRALQRRLDEQQQELSVVQAEVAALRRDMCDAGIMRDRR